MSELYIRAGKSDYVFFEQLEKDHLDDVVVSTSRNFDGSAELVEVFVTLSPAILSALTVIVTQILEYMKSKHHDDATDTTEISIEVGDVKMSVRSADIDDVGIMTEKTVRAIENIMKQWTNHTPKEQKKH